MTAFHRHIDQETGGHPQVWIPHQKEASRKGCGGSSTKMRKISIQLGWLQRFAALTSAFLLNNITSLIPETKARNIYNLQAVVLLYSFVFAAKGKHIYSEKAKKCPCSFHTMSLLEAKTDRKKDSVVDRGHACLNEADPIAAEDRSRLSLTSKEAESDPPSAYGHSVCQRFAISCL